MWFLALLFFALVLAIPVALVLSIVNRQRLARMNQTLAELQHELDDLQRQAAGAAAEPAPSPSPTVPEAEPVSAVPEPEPEPEPEPAPAEPTVVVSATSPVTKPTSPPPGPPVPPQPEPRPRRQFDLERILGGQWLTWVGVLALFFGSAFFLAVDLGRSQLAGLPQVLIGLAVAAAFNVVGNRLAARRERILGLGLLGGGVALLYLAAYAAHGFHHLMPLWLVFPLLLVAAGVGSTLALNRHSLIIASLTLTGAYLTPLVLSGGENPTYGLLPYLVAVNLGAVLVGARRGWAGLPLGAFLANLVLVAMWWDQHFDPSLRGFTFICVTGTWLVFAVSPWLRRGGSVVWSALRAGVLAANGLIYALLCYNLLADGGEHLRGPMLLLLAGLHVAISRIMERRRGADPSTRLTFTTGVILAAISVPVQLDLAWVTLGWIGLAVVLLWSGVRERDPWQRGLGLGVLVMSSLRALITDLPQVARHAEGYSPWFNGEFLAGLVLVGVLAWLVRIYFRRDDILTAQERQLRSPLLVASVLVGLWKLSAELVSFFGWWEPRLGRDLEHACILSVTLLWALVGAGAMVGGLRASQPALRKTGDLLLGLAVAGIAVTTLALGQDLAPDYRPLINPAFLHGALLTVLMGGLHSWLDRRGFPTERHDTPLLLSAVILGVWKLSAEIMGFFGWWEQLQGADFGHTATLVMLLMWAVVGAALVRRGVQTLRRPLRLVGDLLVLAAVAVTAGLTLVEGTALTPDPTPVLNLPFLQGLALTVVLGWLFRWFRTGDQPRHLARPYHGAPLVIVAALLLLQTISYEVGVVFAASQAQDVKSLLTLSVVWAAYAGALVFAGFARSYRPIRLLGIVLLAVTVLKVFVVDMQELDRGYRVVAFVVLGVLLLAISRLYQREQRRD